LIAPLPFVVFVFATAAHAQTAAGAHIEGVPAQDPPISLSLRDRPAGEVIATIAERARWELTASGERMAKKVSVRVKDRPASEVLGTVLEVAGLHARFEAGAKGASALVVRDAEPEGTAAAVTAPPPALPAGPPPEDTDMDRVKADTDEAGDSKGRRDRDHRKGRGRDRTAVGESIVIGADETVHDVVSTGGTVTVRGHVTGDATAVGGSVILEPGARVDGDAVSVGGHVEIKPGASVGGEQTSVGGPLGKILSSAIKAAPQHAGSGGDGGHHEHRSGFFGRMWWTIPFFVLGFLIMVISPSRLLTLREALAARPGAATAAGVGSWFGIVALCVLLAVTLIGIPLVPVAIIFYFGLGLFGLTTLAWWTGTKLTFIPGSDRPLVAFTIGTLLFALISAIPYLGTLSLFVATTVSGGGALLLVLAAWRNRRRGSAVTPPPPEDAALTT
jgi:hypothetical protein